MNHLYYGDNLDRMQRMHSNSVDLIYLDPPFNSKQNYNLMYKNLTGKPVPDQAQAFCDTWEMDDEKEELLRNMPVLLREYKVNNDVIEFWRLWMRALRDTQPHVLAYLLYMTRRLLQMKVILKPTGSIYLHCDPTASHYIKVMMDAIFDHRNFQNEVIWKRTSAHANPHRWGPVHDVIMFYTKSENFTWNSVYQPYDPDYLAVKYKHKDEKGHYRLSDLTGAGWGGGDSGKDWQGFSVKEIGRHWAVPKEAVAGIVGADKAAILTTQEKLDALNAHGFIYWTPRGKHNGRGFPQFKRYLIGGVPVQDVITDISPINSMAKERLGYPTQKPIALLERIIRASSNEGDTVFDPFCGCGTTIYAAERTHRQWIGCDIAILSVNLVKDVLEAKYKLVNGVNFEVDGIPVSEEQAQALFKRDPYQFQHWFVEKVGGFPTRRMSGDKGIDGRLYFETKDGLQQVVLSVKGGKMRPTDVRDLRGVLERESDAAIAGMLSLEEPSKAMREEAARAGMYEYSGTLYPRIQFLTAKDVLEERRELRTPTKLGSRAKSGQTSFAYDEATAY